MKPKRTLSAIIAATTFVAIVIVAGIYFHDRNSITDGDGFVAFDYKGNDMVLAKSGLNKVPSEYLLSNTTISINDNSALLISGEYQVYSSASTNDIVYIFVDDDNIEQVNRGYWQFVSTEIYNDIEFE